MSRGLRILYHHRIRADDGQAVHVRELIQALRESGHEVLECALVRKSGDAEAGRPSGAGFWKRLALPRTATEVLEILYDARGRRMLRHAARASRPDFVYERHALHCRSGLEIARELGVPFLLEVNSPMSDEMSSLGLLRFGRRARKVERQVLVGADRVLAVTGVLARRLAALGADPARTIVVPNAAVPARYGTAARAEARRKRASLALPRRAFLLGFVGYAREWHRLDLVLEAMKRPSLDRVHLAIAGEGPALPGLACMAREAGLASRVHRLGTVPRDDLPAWVFAFDAALIAGINPYASPLKLFDAMAAGRAVVAPDQENLREILIDGENALLFEPGNVGSLAESLERLLSDPGLAPAIGERGRETLVSRNLTWAGNAERVIAAFEEARKERAQCTR
ncbi:MAG: glycosyltransferase family 4 protein [Planctomycetota bacterium]